MKNIDNLTLAGCYDLSILDTILTCTKDTTICIQDLTATTSLTKDYNINIYPNPTNNYTEIDFRKTDINHAKISIYNTSGNLVSTINKDNAKNYVILDLKQKASGLYIVKIDFEGGVIYEKVMRH